MADESGAAKRQNGAAPYTRWPDQVLVHCWVSTPEAAIAHFLSPDDAEALADRLMVAAAQARRMAITSSVSLAAVAA